GIEVLCSGFASDPEPNCLHHDCIVPPGLVARLQSAYGRESGVGGGDVRPVDRGHERVDNSVAQAETLPKSRTSASRSTPSGSPGSPSEAKKISCRIIEFIAISSSRLRPLITKIGAVAKSNSATCF